MGFGAEDGPRILHIVEENSCVIGEKGKICLEGCFDLSDGELC